MSYYIQLNKNLNDTLYGLFRRDESTNRSAREVSLTSIHAEKKSVL